MTAPSMPNVLMTNHVHLLVTPATAASVPRMMQALGRRYVRHANACYSGPGRCGRAATGRLRSTATGISSPAAALSSSIPCGRGWSAIRGLMPGRAIVPMPKAKAIRC